MTTLALEHEPVATGVSFGDAFMTVSLADGRELSIPLGWYPRLLHGTFEERNTWRLLGDGYAVEWPALDEHIGINGLLAGRRSGESEKSLQAWLDERSSREA